MERILKRQSGAEKIVTDIEKGTSEITWKKGAKFDAETYNALKKSVSNQSDFTLRWIALTAKGEVTEHDGKPAFKVTETNEIFLLADDSKGKPKGESPLAKLLAAVKSDKKVVIVTGRVQEPQKPKSPKKGQSDKEKTYKQPLTLILERFDVGVNDK